MSIAALEPRDVEREEIAAAATLGQHYLGFISYRRRDGAMAANWLRQKIGTFRPPAELRDAVERIDRSVGGPSNRVFLDKSYQRSHANFWDDHIGPSVRRSRNLLLLLTPSVFEKLPGGEPNWVEREIETFLASGHDPDRILLILGPGAPDDRVPDALARVSSLWDWADLRFFTPSAYQHWRKTLDYEAQLTKILARLFDISDGDLPALTREFERARHVVQRRIYAAGAVTIVGLAGLATWATFERARAVTAETAAIAQRDEAIRQKNAALVAQSLYLTQTAVGFRDQGSARQAVKLLLPALPDPAHGDDRPLVADTVVQSYATLHGDNEIGRVPLPKGTQIVAIRADGKLLLAIEPKAVSLLAMPEGALQRRLALDIGPARRARLAPDGKTLAIELADGAIRIVDLGAGKIVGRHPGVGAGADLHFLSGGEKLLLQSASRTHLVLLDAAADTSVTRDFEQARPVTVSADGRSIVIIADAAIRRLAPDTLHDDAVHAIAPQPYMVSAYDASSGTTLFAAGKDFLQGAVTLLDRDLHEIRTFPLTLGDVSGLSVSGDGRMIAAHSPPNLVIYDMQTAAPIAREISASTSGRFHGSGEFQQYVASAGGAVAVLTPRHGVKTVYKSEDEADVTDVVWTKTGDGFTTVTTTPLVTLWSTTSASIGHRLELARDLRGTHFPNFPYVSGVATHDGRRLAVWYLDGTIGVWDAVRGTLIRTSERLGRPEIGPPLLVSSDDRSVIGWTSDGRFFRQALDTADVTWFGGGRAPVRRAFFLDANRLAIATADGGLLLQDLDHPSTAAAKIEIPPECAPYPGGRGRLACLGPEGLEMTDVATRRRLWRVEGDGPRGDKHLSMAMLDHRDEIAIVDTHGKLHIRSASTGAPLWEKQLTCELAGPLLLRAADSPILDAETRKAIRSGATHVTIGLFATLITPSSDERVLAIVFPNRTIQLIDVITHDVVANLSFDTKPLDLAFSRHGSQIAILSVGDDQASGELRVFDLALRRTILSKPIPLSSLATVFAMGDGEGFGVLLPPYHGVETYPVWEDTARLVAYMSTRYPERLSPSQRHQFHID